MHVCYGTDLIEANRKGRIEWKEAFQATRDYGMKDLSTAEVTSLISQLKTNRTLFDAYFANMDLYVNTRVPACDDKCWRRVACCMDNTRDSAVRSCLANV